jgi:hypothetical protein
MKKARPRKASAKSSALPEEKCPVLPIALRVGELWDAHAAAQEREFEKKDDDQGEELSEQINELRIAAEQMASFERARSLAGALFQVALAHDMANRLYEEIPSQDPEVETIYRKLRRLLDSVALALRDTLGPDYEGVRNVVEIYIHVDENCENRPLRWLDEIPELAEEYRRSKRASVAASLIATQLEAAGPARRLFSC